MNIVGLAPEGGVTIVDGSGEKSFKISDYRGRYVQDKTIKEKHTDFLRSPNNKAYQFNKP